VSKVRRAKGRGGPETGRRSRARSTASSSSRVSNWAAARLRAARYRAAYGMRLAGFAVLFIGAGLVGLVAAAGRLDDLQAAVGRGVDARLASSGFTVAALDVAGAERVSAEEVAGVLNLSEQSSLFGVDPAASRDALLQLSWVEDAAVARLWPDRVSVVLTERRPFALWQYEGVHHVVDRRGEIIQAADARDFSELPRVVGLGANDHASEIWPLIDRHERIRRLVTDAVRVGERRWNLRLVHGVDVLLPEEDPAAALAVLAHFHDERGLLNINAARIDIRSDGEIVLRARNEEDPGRGA